MRRAVQLAVVMALAGAPAAAASDYYVTKAGNDANACSQALPCLTISGAVAKAAVVDGDTIHIGPGVFAEGVTTTKNLTFEGAGAGTAQGSDPAKDTFVDADTVSKIGFELTHGGTLRHLRVRGGTQGASQSDGPDNAIYLHAYDPAKPVSYTLDNVVAIGGSAGTNGRIALVASDAGGTGATVNVSVSGDSYLSTPIAGPCGMYCFFPGLVASALGANVVATLDGTTLGAPKDGIGLLVTGGAQAILKNATLLGIFGPADGIIALGSGSEVDVDHSSVEATLTPVWVASNALAVIDESLIVAKRDTAAGASTPDALLASSSGSGSTATLNVHNSTVIATGPGIRSAAAVTTASGSTAAISLANTVLQATDTDGTPGDTDLRADGASASIQADASAFNDRAQLNGGTATEPGTGTNVAGDPKFSGPDVGNYVPAAGSPLIDRANPALVPAGALDLAGSPRGVDGDANCSALPDIGAYEAPENTRTDCTPVPDTTAPKASLGPGAQRLPKTGALTISVTCPKAEPDPCAGTLAVAFGKLALGNAAIGPLAPGAAQKVVLNLLPAVQRALRKKRSQRITAAATLTDKAGNTGTTTKTLLVTTRPHLGIGTPKRKGGKLVVRVSCPEGEPGPCTGAVSVLAGKQQVGTVKLKKLARGFGRTLKFALPAALATGKVKLVVVGKLTDKFGNVGRTKRAVMLRH